MAYVSIPAGDVDFKSPIDETLWTLVKDNFDDHESRLGASGGGGGIRFVVNGLLARRKALIDSDIKFGRALDGTVVSGGQGFSSAKVWLKENGTSGQTKIDILYVLKKNHLITGIERQMNFNTQSVGRVGGALTTQAVTKKTPQINTQSIARHKAQIGIDSVINVEPGVKGRYNLDAVIDADWKVGKKVVISGAANGNNNGEFTILEISPDGGNSLILDNTICVDDLVPSGDVNLQMFEYIYANPVDVTAFFVDENVDFAGHTIGASDGAFNIEKINDGGNNIVIYNNTAGATTQGAAAGTANAQRWVYTFAAPAIVTDYIVGENALAAGHTSGNNDGNLKIVAVNEAGNNLVVINANGIVQAGAAGTINTNRWTYATPTDPSVDISLGDNMIASGHTSSSNDGTFEVLELNRFALNNITIYNEVGATQGGVAGVIISERMLIKFGEDRSADYITGRSQVELDGMFNIENKDLRLPVVEQNRGGGANYNLVVLAPTMVEQSFPMGQVDRDFISLFTQFPTLAVGEDFFFEDNGIFEVANTEANSMLTLEVLELPDGLPCNLNVELA